MKTTGTAAVITGYDNLEQDFFQEEALAAFTSEEISGCGLNESGVSHRISLDDVMDDADDDEAFVDEAMALFGNLKQAAADAAQEWDAAHETGDDETFVDEAMALFNDLKQAAQDAAAKWDAAHKEEPAKQSGAFAVCGNSQDFVSAWIEKNDKTLRSIVGKFEKVIHDPMYTAEDLMQEAYLAVLRAYERYDLNAADLTVPSKYFITAVHNRMQTIYRTARAGKNTLYSAVSLDDFDFEGTDDAETDVKKGRQKTARFPAAGDNVEQTIIARSEAAQILSGVKEKQKPIIELTALGYTQKEIADYIGRTQSAISYTLNQFRKETAA